MLATYHKAGPAEVERAIEAARAAQRDVVADAVRRSAPPSSCGRPSCSPGPCRDDVNAATMLGQSKTAFQAEIDSACELIDFLRFNPYFAQRIYAEQPVSVAPGSGTGSSTGRSRASSSR